MHGKDRFFSIRAHHISRYIAVLYTTMPVFFQLKHTITVPVSVFNAFR